MNTATHGFLWTALVRGWIIAVLLSSSLLSTWATAEQLAPLPMAKVYADGAVEMSVSMDRDFAAVAEPVSLRLQVDAPADTTLRLPKSERKLGELWVSDSIVRGPIPIDGHPDRRRWTMTIVLESYESGQQFVPPLRVSYQLPGQMVGERTIVSDPLELTIESLNAADADPTQFRDLKGAVSRADLDLKSPSRWWSGPWLPALALLLLLVGSIYWHRRRREPSARQWALNEVNRIEKEFEAKSIERRQVYAELTHVVRHFLNATSVETSLHFPVMTADNQQLLDSLQRANWPSTLISTLQSFLKQADTSRFSKTDAVFGPHETSSSPKLPFEQVRSIVQQSAELLRKRPSGDTVSTDGGER